MASPGGVEVGRVSVRVVPDTSRLGADLKVALDRIEAQTDLKISTSIDTTELDAQARAAVDQAQLAAGDLDIKTNVDTSQVREAKSALSGAAASAQGFSSSLGLVATAAIVLGPALIPLGAALAGLVATLVAPLAIVGGGLTLFGVIAGFTITETKKQLKVISQLDTKLSGLTKGTQEYADTAAKLRAAQLALTPAQRKFEDSLTRLKSAFDRIPKSIVLGPIIDGMNLLSRVLPLAIPILKVVSGVISDMLKKFDAFARSAGFKDFVTAFAHQLGPDLKAFATIAGNIFTGLFGLFGAFNKRLSGSVLKSLVNLTDSFATWGKTIGDSKGFKKFVAYIRDVGPKVTKTLGDIAGAAGTVVIALAPIGTVALTAIDGLARAIQKIPSGVLTALAAAIIGIVASLKLLGPLQTALEFAIANPEVAVVVALGAAFLALYTQSKPLRGLLADLGDFFKTQLLPVIKNAAAQVLPALNAAFRDVSKTIKENKPFLETMGKLLLVFASAAVVGGILGVVVAIRLIGKEVSLGIKVWHFWTDAILIAVQNVIAAFALLTGVVLTAFSTIVDGAATAFGWMPGIGGKVKAAQASFHQFADKVNGSFDSVIAKVQHMQDVIDATHGPNPFKITVDDLNAVKHLEALQAFRIKDKSFRITENVLERVVGPGGGVGFPGQTSGIQVKPPSLSGNGGGAAAGDSSSRGGTTIKIDKVEAHDYDDFLRQLARRQRSRAGGGVLLPGAR